MAKVGKRFKEAFSKVDRAKRYSPVEALALMSEMPKTKFDSTLDLAVRLGVNPKHADQMVRGSVRLPHGTGRTVRVAVIAKGEKEKEAKDAGADVVGGEDLAEKIKGGWMEFDSLVATPDMMSVVGKLGKILGPRGLMPNPKTGTVTFEVGKAVGEIKAGKVDYKVDKTGIIHTVVGKISFSPEQLGENLAAIMETVVKAKPASSKGVYLKSITLSTTMGPGIKVDPSSYM